MRMDTLRGLYEHDLRELHDAEDQLIRLMPRMAEAARDEELSTQIARQSVNETAKA